MKELRFIRQLDDYGCTIACIAMIMDTSYFDIRRLVHTNVERMVDKIVPYDRIGLLWPEMRAFLVDVSGVSCEFVKFVLLEKLTKHCILGVCALDGSVLKKSHVVVFDAERRVILDPLLYQQPDTNDLHDFNVYCCLEVN